MHKEQLTVSHRRWWLLLPAAVLVIAVGVSYWPTQETPASETTVSAKVPAATVVRDRTMDAPTTAMEVEEVPPPEDGERERQPTDRELAEVAREAGCPWPPRPDTWWNLGGKCLEALNRFELDDEWRLALQDPAADRRAVAAAFSDMACHVPPDETDGRPAVRPDHYQVCAAESMVRLALLQRLCTRTLVNIEDLERALEDELKSIHGRVASYDGDPQENYQRLVEDRDVFNVRIYWKAHMCRSVREEAFDWIEALPLPAIKPGYQPPAQGVTVGLDDGSFLHATLPPPLPSDYTQEEALFRAAHRAGVDVSRWFTVQ